MSPSSSSLSSFWIRAAFIPASLPAILYVRDCYFGITKVRGTSMEPTLRDGDYVLVRKCEAGTILYPLICSMRQQRHKNDNNNKNNNSGALLVDENDEEEDRAAAFRFYSIQQQQHVSPYMFPGTGGYIVTGRPPLVLPGHVIVFQNPLLLHKEHYVKRVVAVGGQWLRHLPEPITTHDDDDNAALHHPSEQQQVIIDSGNMNTSLYHERQQQQRIEALPEHMIHVEGDNGNNSVDSRTMGLLSSNFVVGIAEYIIWPPQRWQRIERQPVYDTTTTSPNNKSPRAIWY